MENQFVLWVIAGATLLGVAIYVYLDRQAKTLTTRTVDLPDGLRFEAWDFSVEMQRTAQQLQIHSKTGQLTRMPLEGGGEAEVKPGPVDITLPAVGLHIDVASLALKKVEDGQPLSTGYCTITLRGPDGKKPAHKAPDGHVTTLTMARVPDTVAAAFQLFAGRVRVWAENMEARQERERKQRLREEEDAAQAAAQEALLAKARAGKPAEAQLTDAEKAAIVDAQIAQWRQAAGFTGNASEFGVDPDGRVSWFIDLANDGRVTLHSDKRTIHSTLHGASISSMGGEIDIGVRDDYWSEDEPHLRLFRLFKDLPSDKRRAWKERLELVRNSLGADPKKR